MLNKRPERLDANIIVNESQFEKVTVADSNYTSLTNSRLHFTSALLAENHCVATCLKAQYSISMVALLEVTSSGIGAECVDTEQSCRGGRKAELRGLN